MDDSGNNFEVFEQQVFDIVGELQTVAVCNIFL